MKMSMGGWDHLEKLFSLIEEEKEFSIKQHHCRTSFLLRGGDLF